MSNMKVLEGIFRTDVMRDFDATMQREGALYAGMSSAGPGFFAFADSEEMSRRLAAIMETRFGQYMSEPTVARAGRKLTIEIAV
jgi:predicted sugar kinase